MYESENAAAGPVEPQNVSASKHGISKVLLVSLVVNVALVVVVIVGYFIFDSKMEKIQVKADNAVTAAQTKLIISQKISDLRDKLGDTGSTRLSDISLENPTYPFNYCARTFTVGTATRADVEAKLLKDGGPMPSVITEGNTVKYKFDYGVCQVTIAVEYDKLANDGVVKSIDHSEE